MTTHALTNNKRVNKLFETSDFNIFPLVQTTYDDTFFENSKE